MASQWSNPKEIQIPMPYGSIAAKTWGKENFEPVLAMHGYQDNAGTFDKLIPLLSSDLYIVAIDLPGHGMSSWKPKGSLYSPMAVLTDIQRVIDYLKWESFNLMGHSLGGILSLQYCSLFPEKVKKIILLDIIKPVYFQTERLADETRKAVEKVLMMEKKTSLPPPVYTAEHAFYRSILGRGNTITEESANVLFKRGCRTLDCGKDVVFSRDIRIKMMEKLFESSYSELKVLMSRIRCDLLIILGTDTHATNLTPEVPEVLKLFQENCRSLKIIKVEGNHFAHLNNPHCVAPHVDRLFDTFKIKRKLSKL